MMRNTATLSRATWRAVMYLQKISSRATTTSSQHASPSQQPPRQASQQPPRQASQQPSRQASQHASPSQQPSRQASQHASPSQQPSRQASQHASPSQQPSRQASQQAAPSQQPSEFSPLPWVDFAAPAPAEMAGNPRKVTFLCNSLNGLSQRLYLELRARGHHVTVHEDARGEDMTRAVEADRPDLVLCPFLTRRVPAGLYNNPARPVLIVHPGIPGDRGPSSIDWALKEGATEWGVTVLQAADEMDAGDIWVSCKFPLNRQAAKSSLYGKEVTQAALLAVLGALDAWERDVPPTPLDYSHPEVEGQLQRKLTSEDRRVDWSLPAEHVARAVRACDSQPGALGVLRLPAQGQLQEHKVVLFGACVEGDRDLVRRLQRDRAWRVRPGDVIGRRNGAMLVSCGEGGVWISHLKASPKKTSLKLPATSVLPSADLPTLPISPCAPLPPGARPETFQDIWTTRQDGICYVHFDFYNGAMSTEQCRRLEQVLWAVGEDPDIKVVVLMGGYNFFSNGIHLNVIESSECAAAESWHNITAIDDVVKAIFHLRSKVTVAAMQGNAGAGGAMMALAADQVWSHAGVVLNPHYRKMALFGSEYWTYSLPRRVGIPAAEELTTNLQPLLATEAHRIGMIDEIVGTNTEDLNNQLHARCLHLQADSRDLLRQKLAATPSLWATLEEHRHQELLRMRRCFHDNEYHERRRKFVYH